MNMKKVAVIIMICFAAVQAYSQPVDQSTQKKGSVMFDVFNDFYVGTPDSVGENFFNLGVNFTGFYHYPLGESNFSFAFGAGLGSHNYKTNSLILQDTSNISGFYPIKSNQQVDNYKRNKITYTYLDIPVEFRYHAKNGIRSAIGFKAGFLIESHSKYIGDDYLTGGNESLHVKIKDVPNITEFRYGVTARFGWKFVNLTGFYSLSNLFNEGRGPEMYPVSVGISLMPF
jgi:hypothetical protein